MLVAAWLGMVWIVGHGNSKESLRHVELLPASEMVLLARPPPSVARVAGSCLGFRQEASSARYFSFRGLKFMQSVSGSWKATRQSRHRAYRNGGRSSWVLLL